MAASNSIAREIQLIRQQFPDIGNYLGRALESLQNSISNLAQNVAADPSRTLPPPNPVRSLEVKSNNNGLVHAVINDHSEIKRGIHYFIEYDTDPAFSQPHVVHLGASRSMAPINLPAMDDDGNAQQFYFRAYSQYPGGSAGEKINFGGTSATPVNPGGSQQMTLLTSTGSGTAQASGEEGGLGFGRDLIRPATTSAKRIAKASGA